MKIMQLLPELNQGGVERGVVELSRELIRRGHESIVVSAGGNMVKQITRDGGQHIMLDVCSKNPLTAPLRVHRLKKLLRQTKPDIVHARSRVPAWLCVFALKGLDIPFVTTVHGFNSINAYSKVMTAGDRVIYGSTAVKDYILKNYKKIDDSILRYVPRGIDIDYFDPEKIDAQFIDTFKKEHNLENRIIITIVGRITEWKGHTTFIKAVSNIYKKNRDAIGLIVGRVADNKDDYYQRLIQLIKELGTEQAFCFAGSQSNVREIYALSNLVISAASTKPETFGRIAAEALAMNTPVIASAHGGSLDILEDGNIGLLFIPNNEQDLTEKIETAMKHHFSDMRKHINDTFSLDIMVNKELAVYEELVK